MNIEAYDTDSLRGLVRRLEQENNLLKEKLKKANIPYEEANLFEETVDHKEEYDPDQGGRITAPAFVTEEMARRFFSMLWGGRTFMQNAAKTEVTFLSATTDGT